MVGAALVTILCVTALAGIADLPPLLWEDDDRKTIPEPRERQIAISYDFFLGSFFEPLTRVFDLPRHVRTLSGRPKQAENINALDEVPNSSWFTNRNFLYPLTPDEVARGPNVKEGPSLAGPWTVIACKKGGVAPGMRIRDVEGDVYILKFDTPRYPEMATAADVIGSKIFHAAGYNVPANSIVYFRPDILVVAETLQCADLRFLPRTADGRLRAMASKFLDGKPKGPFSYAGWRGDDPNDVIRHEHRRELRGVIVIASFINHNDIKQLNTLDMYVEENGRKFLKHHFLDFGATLGSATLFPKQGSEGREHLFDAGDILKRAITLGIYRPNVNERPQIAHPAVGHLEGDTFDPATWKPNLPAAAFANLTDRDGYWGAKIVASFSDEQLRAAARAGRYSDPAADEKLVEILKKRRDRIARYWFKRVAPLDRFRISEGNLQFDDLAVDGGYDCASCVRYRIEIPNCRAETFDGREIPVYSLPKPALIRITRISPGWPERSVSVYVQNVNGTDAVIGVRR